MNGWKHLKAYGTVQMRGVEIKENIDKGIRDNRIMNTDQLASEKIIT